MKKLSQPQRRLLDVIAAGGPVHDRGANNVPLLRNPCSSLSFLVRHGLIEWAEDVQPRVWRLTKLGVEARDRGSA